MESHEFYFQSLTAEEKQLIVIRDFLYEGDWRELTRDLKARQSGKPFVFKLNTRIEEDLERIEKLLEYEQANAVNLGKYLVESGQFPELETVLGPSSDLEKGIEDEEPQTRGVRD